MLGYLLAGVTEEVAVAGVGGAGPCRKVKVIHGHHVGAAFHALDVQAQPVLWGHSQVNLQRKKNLINTSLGAFFLLLVEMFLKEKGNFLIMYITLLCL